MARSAAGSGCGALRSGFAVTTPGSLGTNRAACRDPIEEFLGEGLVVRGESPSAAGESLSPAAANPFVPARARKHVLLELVNELAACPSVDRCGFGGANTVGEHWSYVPEVRLQGGASPRGDSAGRS
jgi:hypothetical protein